MSQKKILVISDTHGQYTYLEELHRKLGHIDSIIHLGDIARDEDYIYALFGCPIDMVAGNNDFFSELPGEYTIRVGRHLILLTHGHAYSVHNGTDRLLRRAKALGADAAMFGHTHCPMADVREGILLVNPGSISLPRQANHKHTYAILELLENGELRCNIHEL